MHTMSARSLYTILTLTGLCQPLVYAASLPVDERSTSRNGDVKNAYGDCPIAQTCQGVVRGTHLNDDVSAFLGVPYAQAPVGGLRFRPPQPLPTSAGEEKDIIDASDFGPVCHQFHYRQVLLNNTIETTPQSEDCLNLNIFVPRKASNLKLLPTLFWSYGGGFVEGGGSMPSMRVLTLRRTAIMLTGGSI
jgi:carboxylesterase type B